MNELETKRKELDNQIKKIEKEDSYFINGILQYISYYDFSKSEVLTIKEELINIAKTTRENKSEISIKIKNQKKYCEDLIKKYRRKKITDLQFIKSLPYDLLITISLILLLFDGSRNPITNTHSLSEILVVRLSYVVIILTAGLYGIMMRRLDKKFVFKHKIYYRYLALLGFSGPFVLRAIYDIPLVNTELFRLNTLNVFMVTVSLGIFSIYLRIKEKYM